MTFELRTESYRKPWQGHGGSVPLSILHTEITYLWVSQTASWHRTHVCDEDARTRTHTLENLVHYDGPQWKVLSEMATDSLHRLTGCAILFYIPCGPGRGCATSWVELGWVSGWDVHSLFFFSPSLHHNLLCKCTSLHYCVTSCTLCQHSNLLALYIKVYILSLTTAIVQTSHPVFSPALPFSSF